MMNRNELHELMERLEALEALAKLFNNLWFERIREDIKDTKVQAYLTVFDDAFPHMNHVIEFVRRSAGLLSAGDAGQEQWARLQSEFDNLHRLLNQPEEMLAAVAPPAELSTEELEALETVDQGDIDSLFIDSPGRGRRSSDGDSGVVEDDPTDEIDALFDTSDEKIEEEIDEADVDALFAEHDAYGDSIAGEMISDDEDLDEDEALAAAQALEASEEVNAKEEDEAEIEATTEEPVNGEADSGEEATQELEELLEGVDEQDMSEEDVELSDLLEEDDGQAETE
ncbi:MAG: hypothetical protein VX255_07020, partial [Candidatus Latescibacterota bacterium]|nr:hypothetical protein [Candidatus Latescibacterota bacterium]